MNQPQSIIDYTKLTADQLSIRSVKFTPDSLGHIDRPATVVDPTGRILVWYLPNMLTAKMHVSDLTQVFFKAE
jgi:hypothetical protein